MPVSIFHSAFSKTSPICTWSRATDCEDSHLLIALTKLADCLAGPLDSTSVEPLVPSFPTILRGISASLSLRDVFHVDVAYIRFYVYVIQYVLIALTVKAAEVCVVLDQYMSI